MDQQPASASVADPAAACVSGAEPMARAPERVRLLRSLCALAVVLLGAATYLGRLGGPFIFDDEHSIVGNPSLAPFDVWRALRPPGESPVAARPLVNLSFALDRALFGLSPAAFHATNLIVHLGCALLVFATLCRLITAAALPRWLRARPELPAFFAAAAFCVHPMAAEIVLYTTQRSEALVALCYLAALWLLLREAQTGSRSWPWVLVVGVLGAGSKEVFATAPLVLLACDRAFYAGSLRAALRQRAAFHAALAASLVPLLLLQRSAPRSQSVRLFELDYLAQQARIVPGYFGHALWPAQPVLDYGMLWPGAAESGWPWLAVAAAALIALGIWVWRAPQSSFIALWSVLILAPSSSVLSIHTEIGAERRFYLPLCAVLAALAILGCVLSERVVRAIAPHARRSARVGLFVLSLSVVALLAVATRQHALDYRDTRSYWEAAVRTRPDNARAHYNLAETLRRAGNAPSAIASLRRALALQPSYPDAQINLSGLLLASGSLAEGLTHAELGAALDPHSPDAHYNLAVACALNGLTERALGELEETVRLQPEHWEAHRRLAKSYLAFGHLDAARAHARAIISRWPSDALAQQVLSAAPR